MSIDGLSWQRLLASKLPLPNLRALLAKGVAGPLTTVFPSQTWPAHASLLTGGWPARHGALANHIYDRDTERNVDVWTLPRDEAMSMDTLFDAAHRRGVRTANVLWPLTGKAAGLDWNLPEVYGGRAFRRQSSRGALRQLADVGLPTDRMHRLSYEEAFELDSFSRDAAVHLLTGSAAKRPGLLLFHLLSLDTLSHRYGPDSRPASWALELCDRYLGQVLSAWRAAGGGPVVVTSDHGFTQVSDGLAYRLLERNAKLNKAQRAALRLVPNGHALFLYAKSGPVGAAALAKVKAFLAQDERLDTWMEGRAMQRHHLGDPKQDPRLPDAIALLKPNVLIWGTRTRSRERKPIWKGNHGYLPTLPELQGVFIAQGRPFRARQRVKGMHVIEVAPTLARALGWPLRGTVDGKVRGDVVHARHATPRAP